MFPLCNIQLLYYTFLKRFPSFAFVVITIGNTHAIFYGYM